MIILLISVMIIIMIHNDNNIVVIVAGLDRQAGERERPIPDHLLGLLPHRPVLEDLLGVAAVIAALVVFPYEVRLVCERREDAVDLMWL